jgi:hypothetical protein
MIEDVTVAIKNMDLMMISCDYFTVYNHQEKSIFHISHDIPMKHSYGNPI